MPLLAMLIIAAVSSPGATPFESSTPLARRSQIDQLVGASFKRLYS